jgi:hypothetical protein
VTIVEKLYSEFVEIRAVLTPEVTPSLSVVVNDNFRKALLLAVASYFEYRIVEAIIAFYQARSSHPCAVNFVRKKALDRQYHTLFEWGGRNANRFFQLFGDDYATHMKQIVAKDAAISDGVQAFLELGEDRNRLVHGNFAAFVLEKTAEDIFATYQRALQFVGLVETSLLTFELLAEASADAQP